MSIDTPTDVRALRDAVAGAVHAPGDASWDQARQAFNLLLDQRPAAVVEARDARDVAAAVRFARANGLRVAPQATGHNAGPLGDLSGTLLLKTSALVGVEVDPIARRARVLGGTKWGAVSDAAAPHGLAALHGSSRDVGVVGYTLGGGLGWLARKHGLQTNAVTAIELVTADGRTVRTTRDHEPELFWALRGGGGNFGVVTAIEFALFPVERLYAGALMFPFERAGEVLRAWWTWTLDAPDEVTSTAKLLQLPPLEEIPEPLRGGSFAVIQAAFLGEEAAGRELFAPLRALGPQIDTLAPAGLEVLGDLAMDPEEPMPYFSDSQLVDLSIEGIDAFVAAAGPGSGSPLAIAELRQLGGAVARGGAGHGARASLPGSFLTFMAGAPMAPEQAPAIERTLARVRGALAPYEAGAYPNFTERTVDAAVLFDDATLTRLQRVKAHWDPAGLFHANHQVAAE
jgi:FAD/FMN-containing dehydrogenase